MVSCQYFADAFFLGDSFAVMALATCLALESSDSLKRSLNRILTSAPSIMVSPSLSVTLSRF